MIRTDLLANLVDLVEAHLGRTPNLQAQEVLYRRAGAALEVLRHLLVVFVALGLAEMLARHLVMTQRGVPVAADVLDCHLARTVGALVAEGPARRDRRQRLAARCPRADWALIAAVLR